MVIQKIRYGTIVCLTVIALILAGIIFSLQSDELEISFLDVGQGDAILISEGNKQILIDGGPNGQVILEKLGKHIPFWDRKIEVVIATHPDADHIQGLIDVMEKYEVETLIDTEKESDSEIYKKYQRLISEHNITTLDAQAGMNLKLAENSQLQIFSPLGEINPETESNASSVVTKLSFGKNTFLLTGDLPEEKENELMKYTLDLRANILKVAHHGSKYSTDDDFLEEVRPQEAIISVGKDNKYGHPAEDLIQRLTKRGIRTWRTDLSGDITYICQNQQEDCLLQTEK